MKNMSISVKNLWGTILTSVILGVVLIASSYFIQGQVLSQQLQKDSVKLVNSWAGQLDPNDVQDALKNTNATSAIQKKMTEFVDNISVYNPNVSQGYVFGTELEDGNKTTLIIQPTHIQEIMPSLELNMGDKLAQPDQIVNAIKDMTKSGEITLTKPYSDEVGTWLTVLYPLKDTSGGVYAYFGMDIDASMIHEGQMRLLTLGTIALVLVLLICSIVQYISNKRTFAPISHLMEAIAKANQGDYSIKLREGTDELGQVNKAFNSLTENFADTRITMQGVVNELTKHSLHLAETSKDSKSSMGKVFEEVNGISLSIKTQSQATAETATSLENVVTGVNNIADSTSQVAEASVHMKEQSERGNHAVKQVTTQMQLISESSNQSAIVMKNLDAYTQQIGEFVGEINDLAEQTNLLALNASIEAARAGEHGRGFAVVASEVRGLSERSKEFSDRIVQLVHTIRGETEKAVKVVEEETENVQSGLHLVTETGSIFQTIMNKSDDVASQIQEVSAATQQMAAETEQISATVRQLSVAATHNSSSINSITENTTKQSEILDQVVSSASALKNSAEELQFFVDSTRQTA